MTTKATIGAKLKQLRENCGYTQRQVANVLSIDRSTYAYYETGKTSPDINTLFILARIYSVDILELIKPAPVERASESLDSEIVMPRQRVDGGSSQNNSSNQSHIYDLTKDERQLICGFRAATQDQQRQIFDKILEVIAENRQ